MLMTRLFCLSVLIAASLPVILHAEDAPVPAAAVASLAVSPESPLRIDIAPGLYLRQIGADAFVVCHEFPMLCNSVLVRMRDGTLVFAGTTGSAEAQNLVLEWAHARYGDFKAVAIDTGYHFDNLGGNKAFIDAGITVHGSDLTVQLLAAQCEARRQQMLGYISDHDSPVYKAHLTATYYPPDHVFHAQDGLTLDFGGEAVQVIHPGPTQAPDKVVVYFPSRRLLFGGCMILGGDRTGNVLEADMENWPRAVRALLALPVDVVVPGHWTRLDPGLVQNTINVLEAAQGKSPAK
jgi:glyoxylase-like metal-dependent hydrolase (beta-lactamase superfamily II)